MSACLHALCNVCVCLCVHTCICESQNSVIVNISFDGESSSGCWPAALLSFGAELPTSGLCQHSPRLCVCVCFGVSALAPELSAIGWRTDLLRLIKGVALIKRSRTPPCFQGNILKAWESRGASCRTSCSHWQVHAHSLGRSAAFNRHTLSVNVHAWRVNLTLWYLHTGPGSHIHTHTQAHAHRHTHTHCRRQSSVPSGYWYCMSWGWESVATMDEKPTNPGGTRKRCCSYDEECAMTFFIN